MSGGIVLTDEPKKTMAKAQFSPQLGRDATSGLIVPKALISRTREVITHAEWKVLDRAVRTLLGPRGLKFIFLCSYEGCPDPPVARIRQDDGGFVLRCGCRDRVFMPRV